MWSPGDVIEYRHVHLGRPFWVAPARVVVWWPAGTRYLRLVTDDRKDYLRRLTENRWELETTEW
ncbi:MAG: hypothetical protein QOG50_1970 [Actinomycetota bacterium]|jgi:hypothetical protein|nr:hypothetical protein [Actinomycetota bacterium]